MPPFAVAVLLWTMSVPVMPVMLMSPPPDPLPLWTIQNHPTSFAVKDVVVNPWVVVPVRMNVLPRAGGNSTMGVPEVAMTCRLYALGSYRTSFEVSL